MVKTCTRCKKEKAINLFIKRSRSKDGLGPWCKECSNENAKLYHAKNKEVCAARSKDWKEKNPDKIKAYTKKKYDENKEAFREKARKYALENPDKIQKYREETKEQRAVKAKIYREQTKERSRLVRKAWAEKNKEKKNEALRNWRANSPEKTKEQQKRANKKRASVPKYRVSSNISRAIRSHLIEGSKRRRHWEELVDFNIEQLTNHLESQFDKKMSWENYGKYWEIDHKIPLVAFNFEKPEHTDFKRCWSLSNLQPLEKYENRSKGAKIEKPFQPSLPL